MKLLTGLFIFLASLTFSANAQPPTVPKNSGVNNLFHTPDYKPSKTGEIPQYVKSGKGKKTLLIIPGLGFDASVFKDFMDANKANYTMYVVTIPGYGSTMAPPMPDTSISYGQQTWNKSAEEGLLKLIAKEKMNKPVVIGHFVQGVQLAVRLAVDHPDKVGGLILMGGPAKFIAIMNGKVIDYPAERMIMMTDKYSGPIWFKEMKKEFFDENNFASEIYSLDTARGNALRKKAAEVVLPVAIRYSCEYFATDVRAEFDKIKCPVLVLRAMYNDNILKKPENSYLEPQFIKSWDNAPSLNKQIKIIDVENAAGFVWKDQPAIVYNHIKNFLAN